MSELPLAQALGWSEPEFLRRTEGSPLRRIGHERWLRNVAIAAGNALARLPAVDAAPLRQALAAHLAHPSSLVREHVQWALEQGGAGG